MTAMQLGDFNQIVGEAVVAAMKRADKDSPVETILEDAVTEASRNFARPDIDEPFVADIRKVATAMAEYLRALR